ncbi:hypothetical protein [Kitasatospora sp. NPDC088351]|uniref:hypothetical protein n=1 Tax=unclassified Kitasatospora TaxID=2633591 RepID=UPI00342C8D00
MQDGLGVLGARGAVAGQAEPAAQMADGGSEEAVGGGLDGVAGEQVPGAAE